ncbi:alpha/beta fold hydrolase [Blastococcus sp. BMG 814]|uniref:Alpha/beta fold hydrolase n=1 Tax=Blastococcus carthaginiensis TaxID=3050034 RepID=A0ABT9IE57_9ACTN|nr:alpha/beta fold hydrolase [Blastococcus carthaginiensis]MDP5183875.1 alpha/beta fold hydrolase [Blastococcus carthaginiensis]
MIRSVLVGAGVVVLLLASLVGLLWVFQRSLIYLADDGPAGSAADLLPGGRDVVLHTSDGLDLDGWYIPASDEGAATVLVANGNGGHRGMRAPLADALSDAGLGVLLFDYRGYAGNPGSPTEEGLARDVRAARTFLLEDAGVPGDRLVYFGESLGAAVVTELATEHPPAGLVLRSPFTDLASVAAEHYPVLPVRALLHDRFPAVEHVARVDVPTTVVLGSADSIVPPEQSRAVAAAAGRLHRLVEVPRAGHNDRALLDGDALVDAVRDLAEHTTG